MTAAPPGSFAARHWYRRTALSTLLLPIAWTFSLIAALRRLMYRTGLFPSVRLPVPVVVVGNLTVGGTGKTPLVIWMAKMLRSKGMHPGIVLRGYAGAQRGEREVFAGTGAALVGDEAVLLVERTGCPVWVGANRAAAASALLRSHPLCNVLICDDGLQHYRLARDLEIAVEDERGHGNGRLLPAGPMREPANRPVELTVANVPGDRALPVRNGRVLRMTFVPDQLRWVAGECAGESVGIERLKGMRLHAVAGIGNPARFFSMLDAMGLNATAHAFPDHHAFAPADLELLDCDAILMTEKDAVKCRTFERHDLIAVSVVADPDPELAEFILRVATEATWRDRKESGAPI